MAGEMFKYNQGNSTHGVNTITHYYDRAGIEAATRVNIYTQFASRKDMPTKSGKKYKISRWQHIYDRELDSPEFAKLGYISSRNLEDVSNGINTIELEEGAGRKNLVSFKKINLETDLKRYGEMIEYTDEVEMFSEDTVQVRFREELGMLANQRYEDLLQIDMLATGNVLYSGLGTSLATMGNGLTADGSLDATYRISYDLIRQCVAKLRRNRAKKNTSIVTGSTKIDTRTINSAYYCIIGPEVKYDLENVTRGKGNTEEFAYVPAYKYASATNLAEGEVGCLHEVRFIESDTALVYRGKGNDVPTDYAGTLHYTGEIGNDAKFDVFPLLFPTEGSFATVGLKGHNKIEFRSADPKHIEMSNPYGTKGWFSYNMWYASIILQEEKLLKVLVLAG